VDLEELPSPRRPDDESPESTFLNFASPSARSRSVAAPRNAPGRDLDHPSGSSREFRPLDASPPFQTAARPLPAAPCSLRNPLPPSGRRHYPSDSCSVLVVSHHLDGFLRAAGAGLLHPAAGHEVHRVWRHRSRRPVLPRETVSSLASAFPRDAGHTLRRVLSASSRTASLRPLPSCRYQLVPAPIAEAIRTGTNQDEAPIRRSGPPRRPGVQRRLTPLPRGPLPGDPCSECRRAEQPTSRLYSTVGVRCDRPPLPAGVARSFHGLCSLSRFPHRSLQAARGQRDRPKPGRQSPVTASGDEPLPLESLGWFPRPPPLPKPRRWPTGRGAFAVSNHAPFQRAARAPNRAPPCLPLPEGAVANR
jgi:hypothetical protein